MRNIFVGMVAFLAFSCSTSEDKPSTDVVPLIPTLIKNINTINSNGHIDTSLIKYEGNKIISMNNTDGDYAYKINYYYTGNLITRREESNGTIINYTYENNKLKTSIETRSNSDGTTAKTKKVYTYNSNSTISFTETYFDPKTNVETLGTTGMLTFKNNNLVKFEEFYGDYISAIDIEYDTKNNPFNNVLGLNLLLEVDVTIFSSNNILKWTNTQKKSGIITQSSITSYTYTYDANGYPIAHNRYSEGKSIETGQYLY